MAFFIKRKRLTRRKNNLNGHKEYEPAKRRKFLLVLLLFILLATNLLLFNRLMNSRRIILYQQQVLINVQEPPDSSSEIGGRWYGLCEKNRIHSINDFKTIVYKDPVLAEHFSDFDWKNARMGKLENAVWTHLAYRKHDRISTTRRVIRLPKDDGYVTDGKRWLRTFCCNDYVLAGQTAENTIVPEPSTTVAANGPDAELDQLVKTSVPNSGLNELVSAPDPLHPRKTAIAVIPEPSPLLLTGAGIAILGLMTWNRRWLQSKKRRSKSDNEQ